MPAQTDKEDRGPRHKDDPKCEVFVSQWLQAATQIRIERILMPRARSRKVIAHLVQIGKDGNDSSATLMATLDKL